jgi:hypothetical protein
MAGAILLTRADADKRVHPMHDSIYEGLGPPGNPESADPHTESGERRARVFFAAVGSCKTLIMGSNPIVASWHKKGRPRAYEGLSK